MNLDSEAAALIEFQQAYQASARVLSTARELFQTLIDVVWSFGQVAQNYSMISKLGSLETD